METKTYWNGIYNRNWENQNDIDIIKNDPEKGFPPEVFEMIKSAFNDLKMLMY
jgi:hypothetical protein